MRIAIIQSQGSCDNGSISPKRLETLVAQHSNPGDLWILPEAFDTGCNVLETNAKIDGKANLELFRRLSRQYGIAICGSYYEEIADGEYSNTFKFVSPEGEYQCAKRHMFGDFERNKVKPGNTQLTFKYQDFSIRAVVCYDLRFPVWCRNSKSEPYDALICVSQWPMQRAADRRLLLQARAMENVAFAINANGFGDSIICLPNGSLDFYMAQGHELAFYNMDLRVVASTRSRKRYLSDADDFAIGLP